MSDSEQESEGDRQMSIARSEEESELTTGQGQASPTPKSDHRDDTTQAHEHDAHTKQQAELEENEPTTDAHNTRSSNRLCRRLQFDQAEAIDLSACGTQYADFKRDEQGSYQCDFIAVSKSGIPEAGQGAFATQNIDTWLVVPYVGTKHQKGYEGEYVLQAKNGVIDASPYENGSPGCRGLAIAGLVNEATNTRPNAILRQAGKAAVLIIRPPIRAGEEILTYYGKGNDFKRSDELRAAQKAADVGGPFEGADCFLPTELELSGYADSWYNTARMATRQDKKEGPPRQGGSQPSSHEGDAAKTAANSKRELTPQGKGVRNVSPGKKKKKGLEKIFRAKGANASANSNGGVGNTQ